MQAQFIRHGDVLLVPCEKTEGKEISHKGEYPLAFGEITGHSHRLSVKDPKNLKVYQKEQTIYIMLMEIGMLTHEEHAIVEIPEGIYRRDMEREYSYVDMQLQQVQD